VDISRVLFPRHRGGGYLSGTTVTSRLMRYLTAGQEKDQPLPLWPCTRPGFTEPAPLDAAGALLPHPCTLTCDRMKNIMTKAFSALCLRPFHRRYVSVALSSRSPALGVTQQVWSFGSPDFPQIDQG